MLKKKVGEILNQEGENNAGITLVALIITILFFYDYGRKCRNINKFLLITNF